MSLLQLVRQRILIVDDDQDVRESLHDELVGEYDVETAAGGREALDRLGRQAYDVVISDLRMPDIGGVEVLERAHCLQPEAVRVLLTGFLDEDARLATLRDDAPFKIGKPWHGTIEVTLKRALEHREITRRMARQMEDLSRIEDELAQAPGVVGLARVLLERLAATDGVLVAAVTTTIAGVRQDVLRTAPRVAGGGGTPWVLDEPLTPDGGVRLEVRGRSPSTQAFAQALVARARRRCADAPALRIAAAAGSDERARAQLLAMARRADVGAMSAAVMHELASLLQHFSMLSLDLEPLADLHADQPNIAESIRGARDASERILVLFRNLRMFISGKRHEIKRVTMASVIEQAFLLCASFARPRRLVLDVGGNGAGAAAAAVHGDLALLTQVLVNLIRNAVDATPATGSIEIALKVEGEQVVVSVTDDGRGVPESLRTRLFEPFATSKDAQAGSGLGLALSALIVNEHAGQLLHMAPPGGGARFVLRLPRAK